MSKINILLVDDKEENLIALEAILATDEVRILKTTSPNEALKLAWDNDVAIALVDVQMPEMDGFELVQILKSNPKTRDILVLFVTAISTDDKYAIKGLSGGAIDYLHKPLNPYITTAKVDNFLMLVRSQREVKKKNRELEVYSIMVNNSADIICELDPENFAIKRVNPAIQKMLDYTQHDVVGKSIIEFIEPIEREMAVIHLESVVSDHDGFKSFESQVVTHRNELIWVECKANFHEGVLSLNIIDINSKKEYQQTLIRSKELAEESKKMKENFLANMSHELRTPINGIMGITHLLKGTKMDHQQSGMLDLIETSSKSLLGVINDVLDLSKIEAGKFAIVRGNTDVRQLVKAVSDLLGFRATEKQLSLVVDIDERIPKFIFADSLRLNQILMNLVGNALKFTEKGLIKVIVKLEESKGDRVKLSFRVEDTGIGIPQNKLKTIFDSYNQVQGSGKHFGGTGLGLTIVKKLSDLKGGVLDVESELGRGSAFTFTNWYQIVEKTQKEEPSISVQDLVPFEKMNVLVAEDNAINQFIVVKLLSEWNAVTDVAENGLKVLEMLKEKDYDIILMDSQMPLMDGYETARKIRSEFPDEKRNIPIISVTAAVLKSEQREAMDSGMNAVVPKPYDPVMLYQEIKKLTSPMAEHKSEDKVKENR